jgi:hypothetical protein
MTVHHLSNNNTVILSGAKDLSDTPGSHTKAWALQSSAVRFLATLGMTFLLWH